MNKKFLYATLILTCVLSVAFIYQPYVGKVTAAEQPIFIYDQIAPEEQVYQDDIALFGATFYNNWSDTFRIYQLVTDIYNDSTKNMLPQESWIFENTNEEDIRYQLEPGQSRTLYFEHELDLELASYNLTLRVLYIDVTSETENFNDVQIGNNVSIEVIYRRPQTPQYIWAVLVILTVGILAIIVAGLVSWIRERRSR